MIHLFKTDMKHEQLKLCAVSLMKEENSPRTQTALTIQGGSLCAALTWPNKLNQQIIINKASMTKYVTLREQVYDLVTTMANSRQLLLDRFEKNGFHILFIYKWSDNGLSCIMMLHISGVACWQAVSSWYSHEAWW